jgi:Shedu protein SduA, C-terminal
MKHKLKKGFVMNITKGVLPYKGPLAKFGVKWRAGHTPAEAALRNCLQTATTEPAVQLVLEEHPVLLARALGGGHGRWVIPQKALGAEHVPDFIIGEKSSLGYEWTVVELESPTRRMFNKNGDPSKALNHAIRQIVDWRYWLTANLDYARRSRNASGLGLYNIDPDPPGLILLGRREPGESSRARRRQYARDLDIRIHSIDWLFHNGEALLFPDAD